jgi:hypothetical protein
MSGQGDHWVEDDAPTTWALVIGIDQYDNQGEMPPLTGAAADAVAAVQWLRQLGVPAEQILLHAAPSHATKPALDALGVPYGPARANKVFESIAKLDAVKTGTRLYVFLSGHGLYEPSSHRLFLLQDAGKGYQLFNLGIRAYSSLFRSWPFKRQFLFMDGCQNYPYSLTERQKIEAAGPPGIRADFTPDPQNSLIACFAASQGQTADEVNGRGAFLNRLLPALNPDEPWLWAVDLDFGTGRRTVDLRKLIYRQLVEQVEQDTANRSRQRVQAFPLGAAQSEDCWPIIALRSRLSSRVRVDIKPAHAVAAVESLYVRVRDEPQWSLPWRRHSGKPIVTPIDACLPKGLQGRAECNVSPSDEWRLYRSELKFDTSSDKDLIFNLSRRRRPPSPPPPPIGSPGPAAYASVETVGPDGQPMYPLYDYAPIAEELGIPEPHTGDQVAPGVTIIRHEDGPEFTGTSDASVAVAETAFAWADVINKATTADIAVVTSAWGRSDTDIPPNVRVIMPSGGADRLAGPLASVPVVSMTPVGEPSNPALTQWYSLQDLEAAPELRVEPGPTHVALTLPWGSWAQTMHVSAIGTAKVAFPASVGTPPLRVSLTTELGRPGQDLLGTSGPNPLGWVGPAPGSTAVALQSAPSAAAAWAFSIPDDVFEGGQALFGTLRSSPALTFPLRRGWTLAVDLPNRRVEPLSATATPEWDLLVGLGLIDAIEPERAVELIRLPTIDLLLRLAAAYVLWSAEEFDALQRSGFATLLKPQTLDQTVLTLAMYDRLGSPQSPQAVSSRVPYLSAATVAAVLRDWAHRKEVPLLRWGLGLTLNLIDRVTEDADFDLWRSTLLAVEAGLSGTSTWTAYTPAPGNAPREPVTVASAKPPAAPTPVRRFQPASRPATAQRQPAHAT